MGKCKFRNAWLLKKDNNGEKISSWASKLNEAEVYCKICTSTVDFLNKGFHALLQHAESTKHKKLTSDFSQQMLLVAGSSEASSSEKAASDRNSCVKLYSVRNAAIIAELIWVMKSVSCNFSASSCHNIKETFSAMFLEGVPKDFSLSPKKMNYLITDALQPYFYNMLLDDIGSSFYTICFDETTNVEDKKELQIVIRYWSETKGEVITRHLQTYFIGRADAQALYDKINCALQNAKLSLKKILMIGSDGPNVNKKVHMLFNESLLEIRSSGLIDIGTCPIHMVHNAFLKALQTFGEDASDLAVLIYHYFNGWPVRWEDYEKIQEELKLPDRKFVKHSPSRWLTFHHAAERLIEQWEGIIYYFQKFIPLKKNKVVQSSSYKRISCLIRNPTIKAELYFTMSSAELFMSFTQAFQKDEPLVHILFLKLQELVEKLARRVCKDVQEDRYDELFETQNLLPMKDIVVSQYVRTELTSLPEKTSLNFMRNVKDHYIAGCKYLILKALNNCSLAKSLKCLNPSNINNRKSCQDLVTLARKLPMSIKEDILLDEFKILQLEAEVPSDNERIDHYWNQILRKHHVSGDKKYVELAKVVKAGLSLSHGNADVERRFSMSRWALTEEKAATTERTFNAILTVKDSLKNFSNKPELVPMTSKLIIMAQNAHKHYVMYMEEQKKLRDMEMQKKEEEIRLAAQAKEQMKKAETNRTKITQIEDKISKSKQEHKIATEATDRLFEEANNRLKNALKKGDLSEISVAQGMLEGIISMRKNEQEKLKEVGHFQKNLEKRKNNIKTFFAKKPKIA